eukprot:TRINITY_DN2203_c0_g1_i1.p1 TRINITY_DN2203_c0_g1~~TRINITY_DN2203_c0_g1_i1.p1  ORF type:complete len:1414 (-),score=441.97 TRINITY_DN2203_c0_g1_i1:3-4244(-)
MSEKTILTQESLMKHNKDFLQNLKKLREKKDSVSNEIRNLKTSDQRKKFSHIRSTSVAIFPGHELSIMENTMDVVKSNNQETSKDDSNIGRGSNDKSPKKKKPHSMKITSNTMSSKKTINKNIEDLFESDKNKSEECKIEENNPQINLKPKTIIKIEPSIDLFHLQKEILYLKKDCTDMNSKKILDNVFDSLQRLENDEQQIFIKREKNILEKYEEKEVIKLQRMIRRWLNLRKVRRQSKRNIDHLRLRRNVWVKFLDSEKEYFMNIFTISSKYYKPLQNKNIIPDKTLDHIFRKISIMKDSQSTDKSPKKKKPHSMKITSNTMSSKKTINKNIEDLFESDKNKSEECKIEENNPQINLKPKTIIKIEPSIDLFHLQKEILYLKKDCTDMNSKKILDNVFDSLQRLENDEQQIFIKREKNILEKYEEKEVIKLQRMIRRWLNLRKVRRQSKRNIDHLRLRRNVWVKFLDSEKEYFMNIFTISSKYYKPLQNKNIIPDKTLDHIFRKISIMKDRQKNILTELIDKDNVDKFIASTKVGSVFKKEMLPILQSYYVPYVDEFMDVLQKIEKCMKKFPEFKNFIEKTNLTVSTKSLLGLLVQPILRTTAYERIIDELVALIPQGHKEGDPLREAADTLRRVNFTIAIKRRNSMNIDQLMELFSNPNDKIFFSDFMKSIERNLLREGPINEVNMNHSETNERNSLYLFNDYIALAKNTENEKLHNFTKLIELQGATISEEKDVSYAQNIFSIRKGKTRMLLSCSTLEEKKSWMLDITRAIQTKTTNRQLTTSNKTFSMTELDEIQREMKNPASGVSIKNRKIGFKTYPNSFLCSDAIDWLMRNYNLGRNPALELGQCLERFYFIHSVTYNSNFEDKGNIFVFQDTGEGSFETPPNNEQEWAKLMFHPTTGVKTLVSKKSMLGKKKTMFLGSDLVTWFSKHFGIRRNISVAIATNMFKSGLYFKAVGQNVFADEKTFTYYPTTGTTEDSGFPTEKIVRTLKELKNNSAYTGKPEDMDYVVKMLMSGGNLYMSNINQLLEENQDIDQDTKKFVLEHTQPSYHRNDSLKKERLILTKTNEEVSRNKFLDTSEQHPLVKEIMPDICNWNFPIYALNKKSKGNPLFYMGYALFVHHDLINKFNIPEKKLVEWLKKMDEGYKKENDYHNAVHASDVAQTMNFFLTRGGLSGFVTDVDIFAGLVAAIIHDYEHPGVNNAFIINSHDDIAIRYNDMSVLENHHVASAYFLLNKDEYNIFEGCPEMYKEIRETVIKCVLATDFSKHFEIVGQFKSKLESGIDFNKLEDRRLALMVALKCADVSHTAKEMKLHVKWTKRVTNEFYNQGDIEKSRKLPLSPYMDRATGDLPKSQIGFISFLVQPLYSLWVDKFPSSSICVQCLLANLDFWKKHSEEKTLPQEEDSDSEN